MSGGKVSGVKCRGVKCRTSLGGAVKHKHILCQQHCLELYSVHCIVYTSNEC